MLMVHTFQWNIPGNKWNFEKVVLFSRWKFSGEKACSIYKFSQGITSSRLSTAIYICTTILNFGDQSRNEWNLRQMEHVLHSMDLYMEVFESFWPLISLVFTYLMYVKITN